MADNDAAISAHASIDPGTRRAKTHHLFHMEVVRPSEPFDGEIAFLGWAAEPALPAEQLTAWLTAALLFTRRAGGRRRRGWGRCWFKLPEEKDDNKTALEQVAQWIGGRHANA